jgi:hypothetical protein
MGIDEFVRVGDPDIRVAGGLIHIDCLDGEYQRLLGDPAPIVEGLLAPRNRENLYTIVQRPQQVQPK